MCDRRESNPRPLDNMSIALTSELRSAFDAADIFYVFDTFPAWPAGQDFLMFLTIFRSRELECFIYAQCMEVP